MYGIVGFPTPQDTALPEAAADDRTKPANCNFPVPKRWAAPAGAFRRPHPCAASVRECATGAARVQLGELRILRVSEDLYDNYHGDNPPCDSVSHGGSCHILGDVGVSPDLLDGDPSTNIGYDDARRIALDSCAANDAALQPGSRDGRLERHITKRRRVC